MIQEPLVLSIQSHMTHGRSGNRSAVFPIEINGIDCDPLNTVNFSTHTAYKHVKGTRMNLQEFQDIISGLRLNDILKDYTHMLTGYVGDPSIIDEMCKLRMELGDNVHYFCDPVLGDCGRFYVSQECLGLIQSKLVPIANTISPNSYEAEWLTNRKMETKKDLLDIVKILHNMGPENVVVTSTNPKWPKRYIFFSFQYGREQFAFETGTFDRKFDGPGDVFAALLLANMIKYPMDYELIAQRTVNAVYCVLKKTVDLNKVELALPQSVQEILNPPNTYKPIYLESFLKENNSF